MVRSLRPRRLMRIGSGRTVGCCCCCCWQRKFDGRLWRKSPSIRMTVVSRLALGRKQRIGVAGS